MDQIGVVTDSTSDIPPEMAAEWGIRVVPCYINFADESLLDQVELSRDEFYQRLIAAPVPPTTAAPPPGLFAEAYRELLDKASAIVSIHPSDHLSGLRQSAINGWEMVKTQIPFQALDAGQLSMGLGWIVLRVAQAAAAGASLAAIGELLADLRKRVHLYAALDTVEYLQRSGRVGWAQGTIGRLLRVRPLIKLYQGEVISEGYVRTRRSAFEGLIARAKALGELECLTVLHANAPHLADQFRGQLADLSAPEPILTINATPVLGTHVGPDAIGLVAIQS
jgi:DegV family protein with EDD domain